MTLPITILIYSHAATGFLALLSGFIAILTAKGKNIHKKSGQVFLYAMLVSCSLALVIALLPNHENPFLFAMGIFSLYLVITGYRALRFKDVRSNLSIDKWISRIMLFTGLVMICLPILVNQQVNIVLTVFGIFGMASSLKDLTLFNHPDRLKKSWLSLHIGKITGSYISAITAFVVVNQFIPGIYGWFVPSIIGGLYIWYWLRKVRLS